MILVALFLVGSLTTIFELQQLTQILLNSMDSKLTSQLSQVLGMASLIRKPEARKPKAREQGSLLRE